MFIDSATLNDLEVVSTSTARGPTLWALVDRTRSRIGREHLRRRLLSPSHSAEEIPRIQQAHQLLWRLTLTRIARFSIRAVCDEVEDYLSSTWQLPNAMRGAGAPSRRPVHARQVVSTLLEGRRKGPGKRRSRCLMPQPTWAVACWAGHSAAPPRPRPKNRGLCSTNHMPTTCVGLEAATPEPRNLRSINSHGRARKDCSSMSSIAWAPSKRCGVWRQRQPSTDGATRNRPLRSEQWACSIRSLAVRAWQTIFNWMARFACAFSQGRTWQASRRS